MKRILNATAVLGAAALLCVPAVSHACGDKKETASMSSSSPRMVTVADVAQMRSSGKLVPVDANGPDTRTTQGVIPGAVLLTSSSSYALSELPSDKASRLVFYCANTKCTASDTAAKRALTNGYTDVSVLPAGIKGWKAAGQPVARSNNS